MKLPDSEFKGRDTRAVNILNALLTTIKRTVISRSNGTDDIVGFTLYLGDAQHDAVLSIDPIDPAVKWLGEDKISLFDCPVVWVKEDDYTHISASVNFMPVEPVVEASCDTCPLNRRHDDCEHPMFLRRQAD